MKQKQPNMRNLVLTKDLVGLYHDNSYSHQIVMDQRMQFDASDPVPCYLNNEERMHRKLDIDTGKTVVKNLTKAELILRLKTAGLIDPTGTKKSLQE